MKQVGCVTLAVLALAAPALAQDPFETTVGADPGDLLAKVRGLAPEASPTATQLRTYLEAARFVGLGAAIKIDDGRGRGSSKLGDACVPTGTSIRVAAKFTRPSNGGSPVLSELSIVPSRPIQTDDFTFHRLSMDRCGNLNARLTAQGRSINLSINKIHRDRCGNLVFHTYATNQGALVNAFVPDLRITPDGRLQTRRKNAILPRNRNWVQEYKHGRPVRVGSSLPIQSWPPRLSDLVALLPEPGAQPQGKSAIPALPISDLGLRARIQTDPILLAKNDDGRVVLRDGDFALDVHGPVRDGVLTADPRRPNGVRAKAKLDGVIDTPDAKAKLLALEVEVDGKLKGGLDLRDPLRSTGAAELDVKATADVADVHTRDAEGLGTDLKRATLTAEGTARILVDKNQRGLAGVLDDTKVTGEFTRFESTGPNQRSVAVASGDVNGTLSGRLGPGGLERARAQGELTTTGPTTIDLPLARLPGAEVDLGLAPGTRIELDTGELTPDEDGNLEALPTARVKAHVKLESGTASYNGLTLAGFVGDGTIDLDAAIGLKLDPEQLKAEDGTPVAGPVPLDLKLSVGFAKGSQLHYGPQPGDDNAVSFGGNMTVELDVSGEVDPETGRPSLKRINGANAKLHGDWKIPTDQLHDATGKYGPLIAKLADGALQNVSVAFTPQGLELTTADGAKLWIRPDGAGLQRAPAE